MHIITKCVIGATIGFTIGMNWPADAYQPNERLTTSQIEKLRCEQAKGIWERTSRVIHGINIHTFQCRFLTYREWLELEKEGQDSD